MTQSSQVEENAINLATIQKTDALGCEVLDKSTSSALYKYANGKWEKCNCDGVFLLYRRTAPPLYGFIVLNKRSTQNHVQHITKSMGLQLQPPFLLYRTESGEINGMWFFTLRDCQRIAERVGQLVVTLGGMPLRVAGDPAAGGSGHPGPPLAGDPLAKGKAAAPGAKQPQAASSAGPAAAAAKTAAPSDAAQSILQMLSRAQTDFKHQHQLPQPQLQQISPSPKVISLDSLFGGGGIGQKPQPAETGAGSSNGPPQRDQCAEMSYQIKEQLGLLAMGLQQQQPKQLPPPLTLLVGGNSYGGKHSGSIKEAASASGSGRRADDDEEEEEEFLLTPGMLECAANQLASIHQAQQPQQQQPPMQPPQPQLEAQPQHQHRHQGAAKSSGGGDIPALTKEQLRESLIYLLEEDEGFLTTLHRAYVASLQRRLGKGV